MGGKRIFAPTPMHGCEGFKNENAAEPGGAAAKRR